MPDFPDQLGAIAAGYGAVVLPGPDVEPDWNPRVRDYADSTFRWGIVVGLEPIPDAGYEFQQPGAYQLELTPDLGWPNVEAMFEPYIIGETEYGNARLIILRIDVDDLTNVGDGSLSYAVPEDTMKKLIAPGYIKYLWRVRAVSEALNIGDPSSVQTFRGRVTIPDTNWSVRTLPEISHGITATIVGTKATSVTDIEINGQTSWTRFLSDTDWVAEVPLAGGRNTFAIRVYDDKGNASSYRTLETTIVSKQLETRSYWNRFDDFGWMMGLDRLPEERNDPYRDRIKDVFLHRAGFRYAGLLNGLNRELDLTYVDSVMYVAPLRQAESDAKFGLLVWLNAEGFFVFSDRMRRHQEYHEIDPKTLTLQLTDVKPFSSIRLEQPVGVPMDTRSYRVEGDTIYFQDPLLAKAPVYVTYNYTLSVSVEQKTLSQLKAELNALELEGEQLLEVTEGLDYSPAYSADGLRRFPPIRLREGSYFDPAGVEVENKMPLTWSEAKLFAFQDQHFRDRYINRYGSKFSTKYDAWAMRMKTFMHTTWGFLVADENVWGSKKKPISGLGVLETVYDSHLGHWVSTNPENLTEYSTLQAATLGYVDPLDGSSLVYMGIPETWLHSGVGDGDDLYCLLDEQLQDDVEAEETVTIVQTSTEAVVEDDELHLGVSAVDSSSEVM